MNTIFIISPDHETTEILRLSFEIDGHVVKTALGKNDALFLLDNIKPDFALIDMMDGGKDERLEVSAITSKLAQIKIPSLIILPRGFDVKKIQKKGREKSRPIEHAIKKPYDLKILINEVYKILSNHQSPL